MIGAEFDEFLVAHHWGGEDGGQIFGIEYKRQGFSVLEGFPDGGEVEGETVDWADCGEGVNIGVDFNLSVWVIDRYGAGFGFDQPAQLGTVFHVFKHFGAKNTEPVGGGFQFQNEVRAETPGVFEGSQIESVNPRS